ncbi:MAG: hypothetical protein ACLQIB_42295 [Isosphaeraceae bacterium]
MTDSTQAFSGYKPQFFFEAGSRLAIREGGKTVGSGVVTEAIA